MSGDLGRRFRGVASLPEAPEICVEVLSPSNSPEEMDEKRQLYAARGCQEFWTCSEAGEMTFLDAASGGPMKCRSADLPEFPPASFSLVSFLKQSRARKLAAHFALKRLALGGAGHADFLWS